MKMPSVLLIVLLLCVCVFALPKHSAVGRNFTNTAPIDPSSYTINLNKTENPFGWVMFKQCDSRWGGDQLGTCSDTICTAGCAMSSTAMVLASLGVSQNPQTLNDWLGNNNGYEGGCGIMWGDVDAFGATSFQALENTDYNSICDGVNNGHGVIINVRNGEHWVLVTGCAGNGVFYVNDPGFEVNTYTIDDVGVEAVYWPTGSTTEQGTSVASSGGHGGTSGGGGGSSGNGSSGNGGSSSGSTSGGSSSGSTSGGSSSGSSSGGSSSGSSSGGSSSGSSSGGSSSGTGSSSGGGSSNGGSSNGGSSNGGSSNSSGSLKQKNKIEIYE